MVGVSSKDLFTYCLNANPVISRVEQPISACRSSISTSKAAHSWKRSKPMIDNEGNIPLIAFGNAMFDRTGMKFKGHRSGLVNKLWPSLKRREREQGLSLW